MSPISLKRVKTIVLHILVQNAEIAANSRACHEENGRKILAAKNKIQRLRFNERCVDGSI